MELRDFVRTDEHPTWGESRRDGGIAWARANAERRARKEAMRPKTVEDRFRALGFKDVQIPKESHDVAPIIERGLRPFVDAGLPMPDFLRVDDSLDASGVFRLSGTGNRADGVTSTGLVFNPRDVRLSEQTRFAQFRSGFWSDDHPDHIVRHEFGHWLHFRRTKYVFRDQPSTHTESGFVEQAAWERQWPRPSSSNSSFGFARAFSARSEEEDIAARVSRYATTNPTEFVAETFTGLMSGRTYDAEVMALYQRYRGPEVPSVQQEEAAS